MSASLQHVDLSTQSLCPRGEGPGALPVVDAALIVLLVALTPFEYSLPTVSGQKPLFLFLAATGVYCVVYRFDSFFQVCTSAPMLCGFVFLLLATVTELAHPYADFHIHRRIGYALCGTASVATLSRDCRLINFVIWSCAGVGVLMGFILATPMLRSAAEFGHLSGSELRDIVQGGAGAIHNHVNELSRLGAGGLVAAMAIFHTSRSPFSRFVATMMAAASSIAVVATISRSGALAAVVSFTAIWVAAGRRIWLLATVGLFSMMLLGIVYPQFFDRMGWQTKRGALQESRADVLIQFIETLPETGAIGIGSEHYHQSWAWRRGFPVRGHAKYPIGLHNCYAQAIVNWGILTGFVYLVYTMLAVRAAFGLQVALRTRLFLIGTSIIALIWVMLSHGFATKFTVVAFGLLVGAYCWKHTWESEHIAKSK